MLLKDIDSDYLQRDWKIISEDLPNTVGAYYKHLVQDGEIFLATCFWNEESSLLVVGPLFPSTRYGLDAVLKDRRIPMNTDIADKILRENGFE